MIKKRYDTFRHQKRKKPFAEEERKFGLYSSVLSSVSWGDPFIRVSSQTLPLFLAFL
uniref:Uncharacterized protein n=1 Tax=Anguilla anguilla TaxID=7936 RepID=A0A0E9W631_ANGAN